MKIPLKIRHIPVHDKVCMHQDSLVGNATWNVSAFLAKYSLLNFFVDLRQIKDVKRTYSNQEYGKYLQNRLNHYHAKNLQTKCWLSAMYWITSKGLDT